MGVKENKLLKKLAGETAVYGMSTIIARFINFLLVPLYTRVLTTSDYGTLTEFMAYIAILQIMLTMGMETGCFRLANKEGHSPDTIFSNALLTVTILSSLLVAVIFAGGRRLAADMGYGSFFTCFVFISLILWLDSFTAILFARLRFLTKAWKFAIFKTIKILTEAGTNLFLFFALPHLTEGHADAFIYRFISVTPDFTYPVFAIFASCVVCFILFVPDLLRFPFRVEKSSWKELFLYSFPLMIAGLPGVMNDFLDRLLFRFFNVDSTLWRADLGIYQAAVKVAVIMSLFVQMFRFAAEPFFFARAREKDSKELYATVMEYFTAFCMIIFLGIVFYIDIIELLVGRDFRQGMEIVPIMLLSFVLLGMLFNVSMWYKLSDRSSFAIWITLTGCIVTAVINIEFLPKYSYYAAAWGHFFSYLTMLVISALLGNKYYKIPYRWWRIAAVIAAALLIYGISFLFPADMNRWVRRGVCGLLIVCYVVFLYIHFSLKSEKQNTDEN